VVGVGFSVAVITVLEAATVVTIASNETADVADASFVNATAFPYVCFAFALVIDVAATANSAAAPATAAAGLWMAVVPATAVSS
jgi:hypothetical protein